MILETKNFKITKIDIHGHITSVINGNVKSTHSKLPILHTSIEDALLRGMAAHALSYTEIPRELRSPAVEMYDKEILRPGYHLFKENELDELMANNDANRQPDTQELVLQKRNLSDARLYMALAFDERVTKNDGRRIEACVRKVIRNRDKNNKQFNMPNYNPAISIMLDIENAYSRCSSKLNTEESRRKSLVAAISEITANSAGIMSGSYQAFKGSISPAIFIDQVNKDLDIMLADNETDVDSFIEHMLHTAKMINNDGFAQEDHLLNMASKEFYDGEKSLHDEAYYFGSVALSMINHSESRHSIGILNAVTNAAMTMDKNLNMDDDFRDNGFLPCFAR